MKLPPLSAKVFILLLTILSLKTNADTRLEQLTKQLNNLSLSTSEQVKLPNQRHHKNLTSLGCRTQKNLQINLHNVIEKASLKSQIPPEIIAAVMSIESNFKPCAISKSGAMGLMQLMPKTANSLGIRVNKGESFNINANVNGGATLLAANLKQKNGNLLSALVMYNAGSKYLSLNWHLWKKETQNYLIKFSNEMEEIQRIGWKKRVPKFIHDVQLR